MKEEKEVENVLMEQNEPQQDDEVIEQEDS